MDWKKNLIQYPPKEWETLIHDLEEDLNEIDEILNEEKKQMGLFEPDPNYLFRCYYLTPLSKVKIVFVTYEPIKGTVYGTFETKSQGLGPSVRKDDLIPIGTQNMYKELERTIEGFQKPFHGDLSSWAYRGIFFLTMALSVCPNRKNGDHTKLWAIVIRKTCELIINKNKNVIFILNGKETTHIRNYLTSRTLVIETPSIQSQKFIGCNVFTQINNLLKDKNEPEFQWQIE